MQAIGPFEECIGGRSRLPLHCQRGPPIAQGMELLVFSVQVWMSHFCVEFYLQGCKYPLYWVFLFPALGVVMEWYVTTESVLRLIDGSFPI